MHVGAKAIVRPDIPFGRARPSAGPSIASGCSVTIEYVRYSLTKHSGDDLVAAYRTAGEHLRASPECLAFDLTRCEEDPGSYILRIHWTSTADHLQKFRKGPHFPPFFAAIKAFVDEIVEMRHYADTGVEWLR
ncbi:antibiotic biosynthesis monooxygenase [Bradyrhizobium manausense]|uniref:putative quinol monooxygenase n=1 Tax=Bradyrhizobium manausense TaxID=989370 RepID=UPI001BAD5EC1|nr:antibiotic biosynthesis monooxygenase family protein [Bradyrhizobium manausense]MBR1091470.1 antibiotic biosynthesis monooxygenase [Bradyrhizobium manausense]